MNWHIVSEHDLPPEGELVETITATGGRIQSLRYEKGLWWLPDRSVYVYYTPQFWRRPWECPNCEHEVGHDHDHQGTQGWLCTPDSTGAALTARSPRGV